MTFDLAETAMCEAISTCVVSEFLLDDFDDDGSVIFLTINFHCFSFAWIDDYGVEYEGS